MATKHYLLGIIIAVIILSLTYFFLYEDPEIKRLKKKIANIEATIKQRDSIYKVRMKIHQDSFARRRARLLRERDEL